MLFMSFQCHSLLVNQQLLLKEVILFIVLWAIILVTMVRAESMLKLSAYFHQQKFDDNSYFPVQV